MTRPLRTFWTLLLLLWVLGGCSTVPTEPSLIEESIPDPAAPAKQLEEQGKYLEAAKAYQQLAASKVPPTKQGYQVSAIQAFLKAGSLELAKAELAQFNLTQSFGLEIPLAFIQTEIDLAEKRIEPASTRLKGIEISSLPELLQIQYRQLQAKVRLAQGQIVPALQEWRQLEQVKQSPAELSANQRALWQGLSSLSAQQLTQELQRQPEFWAAGWLTLALLTKNVQPKYLTQAINDWQLRYPNHPAKAIVAKNLLQEGISPTALPQKIVLLFPLKDSQFYEQAEAVRQGFIAASQQITQDRSHVETERVDESNVLSKYEQAVKAGADFIVGPLEKEPLALLSKKQAVLPIPTLGLNFLEDRVRTGNFYQFSLAPEDEVEAITEKAFADGRRKALVIVPKNSWGARVLKAFETIWQQRGGQVVSSLSYETEVKALAGKLRGVQADVVFMVAFPKEARQLRLLLAQSLGATLPVYSTSHVYAGIPDPNNDRALDGLLFLDIPWILTPNTQALQLQAGLEASSPQGMRQLRRVYAFGIDAYNLLPQLQQLGEQNSLQWEGQTGQLYLNKQGEIHRHKLQWAQFVNGIPQLIQMPSPIVIPVPVQGR